MHALASPSIQSDELADAPAKQLRLVRAADCDAQPVEWLWPGRIPLGKVTLLIGDPGVGKSLVALDLAARLTTNRPWPNSPSPSPLASPSASTLILNSADDLADTIRPRLDAAGADPTRTFIVQSISDLRHDFDQLRAAVNSVPNCRLIIIDTINAYVGPADTHFQTVVRRVLAPLAELAAERGIAVLAIAHMRKNDGAALYRAAGSLGFVASARSVWTICRDENQPGRHLLLPLKSNLTAAPTGLAYTIENHPHGTSPVVHWHPLPANVSTEDILAAAKKKRGPQAIELEDAVAWLKKELAAGPRSAASVTEHATQYGFHERTLRRALYAIDGKTQKRGIFDGWWWSLDTDTPQHSPSPPHTAQPQQAPATQNTATKGDTGEQRSPPRHQAAAQQQARQKEDTPEKLVPFTETCPLPEIMHVFDYPFPPDLLPPDDLYLNIPLSGGGHAVQPANGPPQR